MEESSQRLQHHVRLIIIICHYTVVIIRLIFSHHPLQFATQTSFALLYLCNIISIKKEEEKSFSVWPGVTLNLQTRGRKVSTVMIQQLTAHMLSVKSYKHISRPHVLLDRDPNHLSVLNE